MAKTRKRQLEKAAKIFALSNTYHSLSGADDMATSDDEVRIAAVAWAEGELLKMGLRPYELLSVQDCIAASIKD